MVKKRGFVSTLGKAVTTAIVHEPGCTKPDVVALCECGQNVMCRTCRWGRGAFPCDCDRKRLSLSDPL